MAKKSNVNETEAVMPAAVMLVIFCKILISVVVDALLASSYKHVNSQHREPI